MTRLRPEMHSTQRRPQVPAGVPCQGNQDQANGESVRRGSLGAVSPNGAQVSSSCWACTECTGAGSTERRGSWDPLRSRHCRVCIAKPGHGLARRNEQSAWCPKHRHAPPEPRNACAFRPSRTEPGPCGRVRVFPPAGQLPGSASGARRHPAGTRVEASAAGELRHALDHHPPFPGDLRPVGGAASGTGD
jgi:hypothetical protein